MSLLRSAGGNVYCGDPDYDNVTAYRSQTYTMFWHDCHGNTWRRTRTVSEIGRSASVQPSDPDRELNEPLQNKQMGLIIPVPGNAWESAQRRKTAQDAELRAHLARRGPTTAVQMADLLDVSYSTIMRMVNMSDIKRAKTGRAGELWIMLPEQSLPTQSVLRQLTPKGQRIYDYLLARGPTRLIVISAETGIKRTTVQTMCKRCEWIYVVSRGYSGGSPYAVYGLRGIHEAAE